MFTIANCGFFSLIFFGSYSTISTASFISTYVYFYEISNGEKDILMWLDRAASPTIRKLSTMLGAIWDRKKKKELTTTAASAMGKLTMTGHGVKEAMEKIGEWHKVVELALAIHGLVPRETKTLSPLEMAARSRKNRNTNKGKEIRGSEMGWSSLSLHRPK